MSITVYLLHYEKEIGNPDNPRGKARHYLGSTNNLQKRIQQHRFGKSGAGIVRAFYQAGIHFKVARKWENVDRAFEGQLKRRHESNRLCPICCKETGRKPKKAEYIHETPTQV